MEEGALTVVLGLAGLIIPISLIAFALALALIEKSVRRLTRNGSSKRPASESTQAFESNQADSSAAERVSVVLSAFLSVLGAAALVMNEIRRDPVAHLAVIAYLGLILLLAAPALLWRSRWRLPAQGLATIALSVVAVLSALSIGFAFVPLLVMMIYVCVQHLRVPFSPV